ncbi:pre-mRNA-splicing factor ATP-dependent RNA helicase DEAH7-like [Phalaenopsis equestris]|uniref:pre-mRNA-splicing factor ATP-dependent RNA helicase DEAH7-like n=1 Tax=Phalaenopsis equestris TaxID=78828 RepID=UPI0009E3D47B|nr:pre-mRNA-splicing factor ATP-dependent RNA helicase DEAH7-like [Phalaenopsis equestris]
MDEKVHVVDINRTADVLAPETGVKGGLSLPNKERPLFRIQEKKSVLGLDVLARAKKASKGVEEFKVPSERTISAVASLDEDEKSGSYGSEDFGSKSSFSVHSHASRRYRGTIVEEKSQISSELTNEELTNEVIGGYASRPEVSIESTSRKTRIYNKNV